MPIVVSPGDNVTEVSFEQSENACVPHVVIELGIVTEVRPVLWNAEVPIVLIELGIITDLRPEPWNVASPIIVIELGITTEFRSKQL